ncbi:ATP-binding protein [Sphingobacterium sp.]|uniref:sensor histidine kinase n=1 Tax=Sphingobacterium sp. TaxID=341027 RepID=UPI00289E201A|nr:ATP-binding protein [Sphingobacterium sp.]
MLPLEENNLNSDFNMKQYSLFDEESQKTMLNIDLFFKDGPFAYVFLDKFFQVFRINDRFLKLFGQQHLQILGRHIFEFLDGEDALKLKAVFENRDSLYDPLILSLNFIQKDNSFLPVDTYVKKFTNQFDEDQYCLLMFDRGFYPDPNWIEGKKELYKTIIETQEQERIRIGQQLHDSVAQILYAIRLNLQHIASENDALANEIAPIKKMLNDAIFQVRNISVDLVPSVLHDFGLKAAILSMCERVSTSDFQVKCYICEDQEGLDKDFLLVVYRVIQELLNNTMKHSSASQVIVKTRCDTEQVNIEVTDNGVGFQSKLEESLRNGIGLQSIKSRVERYEGTLEIRDLEEGTQVKVTLKIK